MGVRILGWATGSILEESPTYTFLQTHRHTHTHDPSLPSPNIIHIITRKCRYAWMFRGRGRDHIYITHQFGSIQFSCSVISDATHQASMSITNSWSLLKLKSIESVMPSNLLILCRPLLLPPSIIPGIRVFSNEVSSLHQVAIVL